MNDIIQSLYINDNLCIGDIEHNKYIDILVKDIPDNEINRLILSKFRKNYKTGNWIFNEYTKVELQKFNALMKSKSKETLHKRMNKIIEYFFRGTRYNVLFNSNKINKWVEVFHKIIKE